VLSTAEGPRPFQLGTPDRHRDDALFEVFTIDGGHCAISLPLGDLVHKNGRRAGGKPAKVARMSSRNSPKALIRREMRAQQSTIVMCECGDMTGELPSEVDEKAEAAFFRRKAAAEVKEAKRNAALCRAEQHQMDEVGRTAAAGGKRNAHGSEVSSNVRTAVADDGASEVGVLGRVHGRTVVGEPVIETGTRGSEAAATASGSVAIAMDGAAADVGSGAPTVAGDALHVYDDEDGEADDEADDCTATRKDCHLLTLSNLGKYMPPDDIASLIFSSDGDLTDVQRAIPATVEAKLLDHLAKLQLFRLRLCTKPFALWLVKSKTDHADVREAADHLIERLYSALEAIGECT